MMDSDSDDELTSDELGDLTEAEFRRLSSRARVLSNPVVRDRAGWDCVLEFEPRPRPDLPSDQRPGVISAFVQVKGIWRRPQPKVRLTRSAASKIANRSGPSFIAGLMFDREDPDSFEVYLLEMIGNHLASVLRSLRQLDLTGQAANTSHIYFPLNDEDRLAAPRHEALRARLLAAVPDDEPAYAAMKAKQRATLGFERASIRAKLAVKNISIMDAIDVLLGTRSAVGAISEVRERRFDIELPSNAIPEGEGLFEVVRQPQSTCRLRVRAPGLKLPLDFKGEVFHASLPGPSGEVWKTRFEFPTFAINHTPAGFKFEATVSPTSDEAHGLREWLAFYRLMAVIQEGSDCELTVAGSDRVFPWRFSHAKPDPEMKLRVDLFEMALKVADVLEIADQSVSARDVYAAQKPIYGAAGFCLENMRRVRVVFPTKRTPSEVGPPERLYVGLFDLGAHRIAYAVRVIMALEDPDRPQAWMTTEPRPVSLELIGKTPAAFKQFVEDAKGASGIDDVLLEELDPTFLEQALGPMDTF